MIKLQITITNANDRMILICKITKHLTSNAIQLIRILLKNLYVIHSIQNIGFPLQPCTNPTVYPNQVSEQPNLAPDINE